MRVVRAVREEGEALQRDSVLVEADWNVVHLLELVHAVAVLNDLVRPLPLHDYIELLDALFDDGNVDFLGEVVVLHRLFRLQLAHQPIRVKLAVLLAGRAPLEPVVGQELLHVGHALLKRCILLREFL